MNRNLDGFTDLSVGTAGLTAGVGLLLMVIVSLLSIPLLEGFVVAGDAAATAASIAESELLFRLAVIGVLLVVVLDVVVAWALYVFLRPVHRSLSMLAMTLRLVYAAVFGVALSNLLAIPGLLAGGTTGAFDAAQVDAMVLLEYHAFEAGWDLGLAIFGLHLLVLGFLAVRSTYVPTVVGALLAIAGLGYAIDTVGAIALESYALEIALFTFVGEVVFLVWLLYRGRGVELPDVATADRERDQQESKRLI